MADASPGMSPDPRWSTWSNGLTALRLMAALPLACTIALESWSWACLLFWMAVASDVADGRVARARGETSALGGLFDHGTDAVFVSTGLWSLAAAGCAPSLLAPFVLAAFAQYVLDSKALAGRSLRASFLGRWNGVLYFVPIGVFVTRGALALSWPGDRLLLGLGWGLLFSTAISMADRLWALIQGKRDAV